MSSLERQLHWVPLGKSRKQSAIEDEPFPPRAAAQVDELAKSMRLLGVLSPLLLRRHGSRLQVVCGYRRLLAAKAAGLTQVPALIADMDDAEASRSYLAESKIPAPPTPLRRTPAQDLGEAASTDEAAAAGGAQRVLVRTAAFLEEIRSTRSLNVPRAEILLDSVLELRVDEVQRLLGSTPGAQDAALNQLAAHSVLVTLLAARVGRSLEWEGDALRDFLLGAYLHDIGMVFIRSADLQAPRALHEEELNEVHSHTRIGCALIAGANEWSPTVSTLALDHHERWNGTGYPSGKQGTEVEFPARLLGFVDAFAALISPRPHRDALDASTAAERLLKATELGLFDPSLHAVFSAAMTRIGAGSRVLETALAPPGGRSRNPLELGSRLATMPTKGSV